MEEQKQHEDQCRHEMRELEEFIVEAPAVISISKGLFAVNENSELTARN